MALCSSTESLKTRTRVSPSSCYGGLWCIGIREENWVILYKHFFSFQSCILLDSATSCSRTAVTAASSRLLRRRPYCDLPNFLLGLGVDVPVLLWPWPWCCDFSTFPLLPAPEKRLEVAHPLARGVWAWLSLLGCFCFSSRLLEGVRDGGRELGC